MTKTDVYYANLSIDESGQYLMIQNVDFVNGMHPVDAVTNKAKLFQYKLDDITGFIYGANSTRFWMQRQAINEILARSKSI